MHNSILQIVVAIVFVSFTPGSCRVADWIADVIGATNQQSDLNYFTSAREHISVRYRTQLKNVCL